MKNLFSVEGKVVVITGGAGVLGQSISQHLAGEGAKVVILARDEAKAGKVIDNITKEGGEAFFIRTDVLDKAQVEKAKETILDKYGRVDVLINAAGGNMPGATVPPDKTIFDLDIDAFRKVVDVNLFGTVIPALAFAPVMVEQKSGSIINFSSESSLRPLTRVVGYGVAKAAINNFTQYLAAELPLKFGEGVRVNAVAPGFFLTDQNRALLTEQNGSLTQRGKTIIAHTPYGRFGQPEDLLGVIQYLASDASKFTTGTVEVVDGGFDAFSI